jgi:hypothetical protein
MAYANLNQLLDRYIGVHNNSEHKGKTFKVLGVWLNNGGNPCVAAVPADAAIGLPRELCYEVIPNSRIEIFYVGDLILR